MNATICKMCGSNEFFDDGTCLICKYCNTKYTKDPSTAETKIDLTDDVNRLLLKCKQDPINAYRYAILILDIDPFNKYAQQLINGR